MTKYKVIFVLKEGRNTICKVKIHLLLKKLLVFVSTKEILGILLKSKLFILT